MLHYVYNTTHHPPVNQLIQAYNYECAVETMLHKLQKNPGSKIFKLLRTKWKYSSELTAFVVHPTSTCPPCHLPIQTSPNCPAPSFCSSFRDSRGISHSSCHQGFCGALDWHGFISFVHNPSASPGRQREWGGLNIAATKTPGREPSLVLSAGRTHVSDAGRAPSAS